MVRIHPPLNALRVFDACARHLSFSRAAEELAVTHGAVSKQIATLEDALGLQLFERTGGGVSLTDEGRLLRDGTAPAIAQLDATFSRLRRTRPGESRLRIATIASFAAHVLMPVWDTLRAALPGVDLDLMTSDRPLDLDREAADVAIRYGTGDWPGIDATPLVPGRLLGVRAPDSTSEQAIQVFASNEWSLAAGETRETYLHTPHFVVAIEAARSGAGTALLPDVLVAPAIARGELVAVTEPIDWPLTFHVIHAAGSRQQEIAERFIRALQSILSVD